MSTVTDNRQWSDADDAIFAGDLTAALGYVTPTGGLFVPPVTPIGLRDRDAGTVSFTTSLGFGRKLARIDRDPGVALAFHARDHGFATGSRYVLVQGTARRLDALDHRLRGYVAADGFPVIVPVTPNGHTGWLSEGTYAPHIETRSARRLTRPCCFVLSTG